MNKSAFKLPASSLAGDKKRVARRGDHLADSGPTQRIQIVPDKLAAAEMIYW